MKSIQIKLYNTVLERPVKIKCMKVDKGVQILQENFDMGIMSNFDFFKNIMTDFFEKKDLDVLFTLSYPLFK
jgi:hypothetical protein